MLRELKGRWVKNTDGTGYYERADGLKYRPMGAFRVLSMESIPLMTVRKMGIYPEYPTDEELTTMYAVKSSSNWYRLDEFMTEGAPKGFDVVGPSIGNDGCVCGRLSQDGNVLNLYTTWSC